MAQKKHCQHYSSLYLLGLCSCIWYSGRCRQPAFKVGSLYLMDDTIPGVARIVHDDVDLSIAKFGSLFNQSLKICVIEHVTRNGNGTTAGIIYAVGDIFGF